MKLLHMHFWHPVAQRCFILFTSLHMHTGSMLAIIFTVYIDVWEQVLAGQLLDRDATFLKSTIFFWSYVALIVTNGSQIPVLARSSFQEYLWLSFVPVGCTYTPAVLEVLLALRTSLSWKKTVLSKINTWLGFVINPSGPFVQLAKNKHVAVLALLKELEEGKVFSSETSLKCRSNMDLKDVLDRGGRIKKQSLHDQEQRRQLWRNGQH